MADLPEQDQYTPGIYQLETSDPVLGGPEGIDNLQGKQLASRTRWLRNQIQRVIDGAISVGNATQLKAARVFRFNGAATGSGYFDGSADVDISLTLADSGVAPGVYRQVQINAKGIVLGGSNPTTLAGYGIQDGIPLGGGGLLGTPEAVDGALAGVPNTRFVSLATKTTDRPGGVTHAAGIHIKYPDGNYSVDLIGGISGEYLGFRRVDETGYSIWREVWHTGNFNPASKANVATTLAGYGIGNAYTMTATNDLIQQVVSPLASGKADKATSLAGYGIAPASQQDAHEATDNTKAMTALRVYQAISKFVVQAGESVLGLLRVATQAEVDAGASVAAAVTPEKMRYGFTFLFGRVGYVVFPTWLNGFIIQWQPTPVAVVSDVTVLFPIPFPRGVFGVIVGCDYAPGTGALNYHAAGLVDNSRFAMRSSANAVSAGFSISLGC